MTVDVSLVKTKMRQHDFYVPKAIIHQRVRVWLVALARTKLVKGNEPE